MADSFHWRVLVAAAKTIIGLGLEEIGDKVYVAKRPDPTRGFHPVAGQVMDIRSQPFVQLTIEGLIEEKIPGTTEAREWGWPGLCWIRDKDHAGNHARLRVYLNARSEILRAFDDNDKLQDVPEVYQTSVEPRVVYDPNLPVYQDVVSVALLKFATSEPRSEDG